MRGCRSRKLNIACEWQRTALHGEPMRRSHPQSGGDSALGCEPESKGIADILASSCVDLFDVGSADISPPRGFHPGCGNARSRQLLNPVRGCAPRLQGFPRVSRCRRGGIPIWGRIEGVLVVRRQTLVGLALVGAIYTNIPATTPASAGWCDCGYRAYDYFAPRVYSRMYSYAYTPLLYRDYRPAYFYGASFYRPRVWGWRSWGGQHWGWSGRRHWGWRGGWSGRHWGRRW